MYLIVLVVFSSNVFASASTSILTESLVRSALSPFGTTSDLSETWGDDEKRVVLMAGEDAAAFILGGPMTELLAQAIEILKKTGKELQQKDRQLMSELEAAFEVYIYSLSGPQFD